MLGYGAEELRLQDISHPADYELETAFLDKSACWQETDL